MAIEDVIQNLSVVTQFSQESIRELQTELRGQSAIILHCKVELASCQDKVERLLQVIEGNPSLVTRTVLLEDNLGDLETEVSEIKQSLSNVGEKLGKLSDTSSIKTAAVQARWGVIGTLITVISGIITLVVTAHLKSPTPDTPAKTEPPAVVRTK